MHPGPPIQRCQVWYSIFTAVAHLCTSLDVAVQLGIKTGLRESASLLEDVPKQDQIAGTLTGAIALAQLSPNAHTRDSWTLHRLSGPRSLCPLDVLRTGIGPSIMTPEACTSPAEPYIVLQR